MSHYSDKAIISFCICVIIFAGSGALQAQQVIRLYAGKAPNSLSGPDLEVTDLAIDRVMYVANPTLTIFLPPKEKSTGAAVIICPGGGYGSLVIKREGYDVAEAFNKRGVAAFVLKYRLPNDKLMTDKSIGPLQDAQRALQIVRKGASAFNVNPGKIGFIGFSAGGHLAATVGTHFNKALIENKDSISLRPDFLILVYAVISFNDSLAHGGTKSNLIGLSPDAGQVKNYSNELQVTRETPVSFLVHAFDDTGVPPENSIRFFQALRKFNIPAEMHVYSQGSHGFMTYPSRDEWMDRCFNWMKSNNIINF